MVILILIIIFVFLIYLKSPIYENFFNDKRKGCFKSINRPLQCLYTYGNFIFPLDYRECSGICLEEVKKQEELYEGFESGKKPSYWCYTANDEGEYEINDNVALALDVQHLAIIFLAEMYEHSAEDKYNYSNFEKKMVKSKLLKFKLGNLNF